MKCGTSTTRIWFSSENILYVYRYTFLSFLPASRQQRVHTQFQARPIQITKKQVEKVFVLNFSRLPKKQRIWNHRNESILSKATINEISKIQFLSHQKQFVTGLYKKLQRRFSPKLRRKQRICDGRSIEHIELAMSLDLQLILRKNDISHFCLTISRA